MKKLLNKKIIISIGVACLFIILSFFNDYYVFELQQKINEYKFSWMFVSKIILFTLIYLYSYFFSDIKKYFKFILFYLVIMILLLLLTYPGVWRWDDIINYNSISSGNLYYWQHYLSSIYYYICMCIVPVPAGIVFCQIFIISNIVGYIIGSLYNRYGKKAIWLYILFLLPSVLDSNLCTIRANICAYIELLIVFNILNMKDKTKVNYFNIFVNFILISLLSVWRPENIVYILIIPIIYIFILKLNIKKTLIIWVFSVGMVIILTQIQNLGLQDIYWMSSTGKKMSQKELYNLSGFIEPFGNLVKIEDDKNLNKVNNIVSIKFMRQNGGLVAFWGGGLKSLEKSELSYLKKVYIRLIFKYFPEFFSERINMSLKANSFYKNVETLQCGTAHLYDKKDNYLEVIPITVKEQYNRFANDIKYNKPIINYKIRKNLISALEMKKVSDYNVGNNILCFIFYNSIFSVIGTIIILILNIINKNKKIIAVIVCLAIKFTILVVTIPMPAYMYFFSTHLICNFIIGYYILIHFDKLKK